MIAPLRPGANAASVVPLARATALVVDGNATSRRFVELSLERSGSFAVEAAQDAAAALDILSRQLVDIVISDTDLADANGLGLYRRLAQESRLRNIPFVFLSADKDVDTKVAALRAGVDDYLVKPCDVAELVARAEALVERQRRFREAMRTRAYALAGDLSAMAFPDLVSTIEMGRTSGVLSVVAPDAVGRVYFDRGQVTHATFGNLSGAHAFQQIFRQPSGTFELTPGACPIPSDVWTIEESVTGLLMEAARVLDTEQRAAPPAGASAQLRCVSASTHPPPQWLEPPTAPSTVLAAQLELAVRDPFTLGELRVWTLADLEKWTRREVGRDRFHMLLVADMAEGVSSMLTLGGAPSERWVIDSLSAEKKAFGLTFFLRHERMIDVVLIDARAPTEMLASLGRVPSVVLVCPPGGDLFTMGTAARVSLDELLVTVTPPAVVGVGNAALAPGLSAMRAFREGPTQLRCTQGALGEGPDDLRNLLVKGIRLWSAAGADRPTIRPSGAGSRGPA